MLSVANHLLLRNIYGALKMKQYENAFFYNTLSDYKKKCRFI